jgi:two-component system cell cycle sensor histidine kinase/response regulator CckA
MLVRTRIMMEKMGFTVLTAMDGLESVEVFGNRYKDIVPVLLDITMRRLNGDDAFWELRKKRDDIPVLLLSGYGEQILSRQLLEAGATDFIQKPYGNAELIEKMQTLLA